jgi:YHS domain-containing protein
MMRQIGKQILTIAASFGLAAAIWLGPGPNARADGLVSTVITDPLTGIAIDGYDPVSYFIDTDPLPGRADFEFDWGGVPWYFASAANRDIFMRNPEVYAPQFGGHCLMSLSRGYLSDGKPRLYVIDGLKLYFFYSTANRDAFLLSKQAAIEAADKNWPALSRALSGPEAETPASSALRADRGGDASVGTAASEIVAGSGTAPEAPASGTMTDAASVAPASADANVPFN